MSREPSEAESIGIVVEAAEPSPAYPALHARALELDRVEHIVLRVQFASDLDSLCASVAHGAAPLGIVTRDSYARVRATASGLVAIGAGVPIGDDEPPSVFVTADRTLATRIDSFARALRAYRSGVRDALEEPGMLGVVLATTFGFGARAADAEALRAVRCWERAVTASRAQRIPGPWATASRRVEVRT